MSYEEPRIVLTDSLVSAIIKLAEGNPGAATVLSKLALHSPVIDPDSMLGGFAPLFDLDNLDIYGARVWMLYKDVCGESIVNMLAVLRAYQLGFISGKSVARATDNRGAGIDVDECLSKVKVMLPEFAAKVTQEEK